LVEFCAVFIPAVLSRFFGQQESRAACNLLLQSHKVSVADHAYPGVTTKHRLLKKLKLHSSPVHS